MPVQITIIGLGQVGASIGLALESRKDKIYRVGHDKEFSIERAAQQKGAVDKAEHNLPTAVKDPQVVILTVPVHQIRETLEFIAPDLKPGTIVVDTSPIKSGVVNWAREILPAGCSYVGIVPTIAAEFLETSETGLDSAKADLFKDSIIPVNAPFGTPGEAIDLVTGLVNMLDAKPMITDVAESDGLMSATYLLPQLISTALLNATASQPGWQEARKVAERPYHAATSIKDDADTLRTLSMHNGENVTRVLNMFITALVELRDDIQDGNEEAVKKHFQSASRNREEWLNDRFSATWEDKKAPPIEKISVGQRLLGSVFGRPPKKDK